MTDVDVIVLDVDGGAMLQACIESLLQQTLKPRNIVVFDNGSRIPVSERLQAPVRVVRSEWNQGFAGGNNEGFNATASPFVALVNNDVIADPDWLDTLVAAFEADEKLAAAQTIIRRDEATIDGAGIDVSDGTIRQIGHGAAIGSELPRAWGVSATAAVFRRAALGDRIFDPRFFAYYEDAELCARLHESGWSTRVLPVAKATHRGSHSASVLGGRALFLRTRNRYLVARMHFGVGRISALLWEDIKLLPKGRSSLFGILRGLTMRL